MQDNTPSASSQTMSKQEELFILKGRGTVQSDLGELKKWSKGDLMKSNKDKCKVFYLAWDSILQQWGPIAWGAALQKRT